MDTVCLIINMQGFKNAAGDFVARELGFASTTLPDVGFISFDLSEALSPSELDNSTNSYCRQQLHGLSPLPIKGERAVPVKSLYEHVARIYAAHSKHGKDIVAYKGGVYEKMLLGQLGIPNINLEEFGCPGVKALQQEYGPEDGSCGLHDARFTPTLDRVPCAMGKAKLLRKWLMGECEDNCLREIKFLMAQKKNIEEKLKKLEKKLDGILQW